MTCNWIAVFAAALVALFLPASVSAAPSIAGGISKPGLSQSGPLTTCIPFSGAGTRAAVGPTALIQVINCKAAIVNRTTGAAIASAGLDVLANVAPGSFKVLPQIMWDPTTRRFYYAIASLAIGAPAGIAFGFSKTGNPANLASDWCHYFQSLTANSLSDLKLGDSAAFLLIGYSATTPSSNLGASIFAVSKPPAGPACPAQSTFKKLIQNSLRDAGGSVVLDAMPANQIDSRPNGYIISSGSTANTLAIFTLSRSATGTPVLGAARMLPLPPQPSLAPFGATQPPNGATASPKLSISRSFSQPVQALDPRLNRFAMWTAHTVGDPANPDASRIRWYEIDPVPVVPVLIRSGEVGAPNTFVFNPAISPDRRVDGAISQFGGSFVLEASQSSATIAPRLVAFSSVNGGATTGVPIKLGIGPYSDFLCSIGAQCLWGLASAQPDPRPVPTVVGKGVVWGSGQYSGVRLPITTDFEIRTWNAAIAP